MFEELNQHRTAVAEQIQKACEIGFTGGELEKAHKVGDIHPNGKWVWTQLPSGRYDWRVIKRTSGGSAPAAPATAQKKKDSVGAKMMEFVNIVKQSPYHRDSERQFELMSDSELKKFRDFSYRCSQDKENLNQRTREECKKWSELADQEIASRSKSDVEEEKKSESFQSPKEIADFIAKKFGTKVKRINGTVSFGNWGDYGAYSDVGDCYEVQIDDLHKVRIGTVISATKSWMHCYKGEILMQTAVKKGTITGKRMFQWNKDGLTSYKPGSNFKDYLEKEYVGGYQKEIGKQLFQKK